jgi:predicted DNA binding CopG/RHH family protein
MKKATGSIKSMTREEIRNYKLTRSDKEDLRRLALLPDNKIDTTDIPDPGARKGWSRVRADRPATRQISIRLNDSDIVEAQRLAAAKGLPCQTYTNCCFTRRSIANAGLE